MSPLHTREAVESGGHKSGLELLLAPDDTPWHVGKSRYAQERFLKRLVRSGTSADVSNASAPQSASGESAFVARTVANLDQMFKVRINDHITCCLAARPPQKNASVSFDWWYDAVGSMEVGELAEFAITNPTLEAPATQSNKHDNKNTPRESDATKYQSSSSTSARQVTGEAHTVAKKLRIFESSEDDRSGKAWLSLPERSDVEFPELPTGIADISIYQFELLESRTVVDVFRDGEIIIEYLAGGSHEERSGKRQINMSGSQKIVNMTRVEMEYTVQYAQTRETIFRSSPHGDEISTPVEWVVDQRNDMLPGFDQVLCQMRSSEKICALIRPPWSLGALHPTGNPVLVKPVDLIITLEVKAVKEYPPWWGMCREYGASLTTHSSSAAQEGPTPQEATQGSEATKTSFSGREGAKTCLDSCGREGEGGSIDSIAIESGDIEKLLTFARLRKDQGNETLARKEYGRALRRYEEGLRALTVFNESDIITTDDQSEDVPNVLRMQLHLNAAQALLHLKRYSDAIPLCSEVISSVSSVPTEIESSSMERKCYTEETIKYVLKGLYRRASAYTEQGLLENAIRDLERGRDLAKAFVSLNDQVILFSRQLQDVTTTLARSRVRERAAAKKMFKFEKKETEVHIEQGSNGQDPQGKSEAKGSQEDKRNPFADISIPTEPPEELNYRVPAFLRRKKR